MADPIDDDAGVPLAPIADRDAADMHVVHGATVASATVPRVRMRSSPAVLAPERAARGSVSPMSRALRPDPRAPTEPLA